MTKIGLIDVCIDGDENKFSSLFGNMFTHVSCFFSLLKDNDITEIPEDINYAQNGGVAEFIFPSNKLLSNASKCTRIYGCNVTTTLSEQTAKVQIER